MILLDTINEGGDEQETELLEFHQRCFGSGFPLNQQHDVSGAFMKLCKQFSPNVQDCRVSVAEKEMNEKVAMQALVDDSELAKSKPKDEMPPIVFVAVERNTAPPNREKKQTKIPIILIDLACRGGAIPLPKPKVSVWLIGGVLMTN